MTLHGPITNSFISQRLRLNYVDWGNPDAPPLLLVHGGRDHARSWDWVAEELRNDWHIIAPDLRGHGDSSWSPDGSYEMSAFVYDMAQLIHQLGLAPVSIIAHSMGGNIATRYAGIFPENVRKLVNIEGLGLSPKMQAERDANAVIGRSSPVVLAGRHGRRASDYFSVDLPVDPSRPMVLVVTYHPEERANRSTAVLVDGTKVGEQAIPRISPQRQGEFFDVQYPIPNGLVAGKRKVTVRFEATGGNETPAVYGVRMVRR